MKKMISLFLLLLMIFTMATVGGTPAFAEAQMDKSAPYLTLHTELIELPMNGTKQISYDTNADIVTWTSDNPEVVSVDNNGLVTALKVVYDDTWITASIPDGNGGTIEQRCLVYTYFIDVYGEYPYYFFPVYWAFGQNITTGYTDSRGNQTGYFGPDDPCTRGQIVTFMYRFLKDTFPADTGDVTAFSDVKKKTYYYDAVKWAVANGITTGYTDENGNPTGEFGPDDICTRAQIVTFIYRLLRDEWPQTVDISGVNYKDVKKNTYYYDAVRWAVAAGITTGFTDANGNPTGRFGPNQNCTRGQAVTFIYRIGFESDWYFS